jgi:hypothetical protein
LSQKKLKYLGNNPRFFPKISDGGSHFIFRKLAIHHQFKTQKKTNYCCFRLLFPLCSDTHVIRTRLFVACWRQEIIGDFRRSSPTRLDDSLWFWSFLWLYRRKETANPTSRLYKFGASETIFELTYSLLYKMKNIVR